MKKLNIYIKMNNDITKLNFKPKVGILVKGDINNLAETKNSIDFVVEDNTSIMIISKYTSEYIVKHTYTCGDNGIVCVCEIYNDNNNFKKLLDITKFNIAVLDDNHVEIARELTEDDLEKINLGDGVKYVDRYGNRTHIDNKLKWDNKLSCTIPFNFTSILTSGKIYQIDQLDNSINIHFSDNTCVITLRIIYNYKSLAVTAYLSDISNIYSTIVSPKIYELYMISNIDKEYFDSCRKRILSIITGLDEYLKTHSALDNRHEMLHSLKKIDMFINTVIPTKMSEIHRVSDKMIELI